MEKRKAKLNNKEQERKGFWLRLWKLLAPSQRQIKILFALTMVFELVRLISPYLLKLIIDKLTHFDLSDIMPIVILIFFMLIAEQLVSFIDYFIDKRILKTMGEVENYLPVAAQKKLVYLSLSYHEKENTGSKIVKIERGTQKIIELFSNMSWEVVPTIAQLFVTLIALFIVDFRFGLSFMLFAPLFIYVTFKVNKDLYPIRKKGTKIMNLHSARWVSPLLT